MLDYGFSDDHVPKRIIPKRVMHKTLPVTFPTEKSVSGSVRARHPLMADGLIHLDTDPNLVRISAYPFELPYHSESSSGTFAVLNHIPDVGVKAADGAMTYIDFVPVKMQLEKPASFERRERELRQTYSEEYGIAYAVHDERCIYIQPRFSNLHTMWKHKATKGNALEVLAVMAVRKVLHSLPLPTTIAAIRSHAKLPKLQMVWEHIDGDHRQTLDDVDRAFSAIMQLVMSGEIQVDLSKPFSDDTFVDRYHGGVSK